MALSNNKVLELVKKLFAQAESEAKIGNDGASILFAEKARNLLKDYHLENPIVSPEEAIIGKSMVFYQFHRANAKVRERVIWFENLARIVAEANFCKVEIEADSRYDYSLRKSIELESKIFVVGTDLDREVAIFILNKLAELSFNSCKFQANLAKQNVGKTTTDFRTRIVSKGLSNWPGDEVFSKYFHVGFQQALSNSFRDKKAIEGTSDSNIESPVILLNSSEDVITEIGRKLGTVISTKVVDTPIEKIREDVISTHVGDIFFLVDCSGSMASFSKMEQARSGILDYASKVIPQNYHIGLIKFGSFAEFVTEPIGDIAKVEKLVKQVDCVGSIANSTMLHDAIQQAMFRFSNFRVRRVICVVTDGFCHDTHATLEIAKDAKKSGIEIMTIGTEDADLQFLKELSSKEKLALTASSSQLEAGINKMVGLLAS